MKGARGGTRRCRKASSGVAVVILVDRKISARNNLTKKEIAKYKIKNAKEIHHMSRNIKDNVEFLNTG